ncbi:MAG TPA: sigma-70 family RNA polymerase sigma factor, partial [Roseiflexaceae bacterium]
MQPHTSEPANHDGYELFRRAIVERDEQAWADSTARYRPMLISWAGRCSASATIMDRCDDIADVAFARAWSALSPERFARFPSLAALLAYLRACVTSAVIDSARGEMTHERLAQAVELDEVATPEQVVLEQFDRRELWRIAHSHAQSEQERVVLIESFMYDLRPKAILARHPQLFTSTLEIYAAKRNLL